ncbi:hypothetical protein WJX74_007045 [Apatococcus lobatus]|uniref:Uncharacterized protein n=1 Tax=Apatococcus lobatus TaxID=904363 RepID=A0AAW1S9J7_9CHLO
MVDLRSSSARSAPAGSVPAADEAVRKRKTKANKQAAEQQTGAATSSLQAGYAVVRPRRGVSKIPQADFRAYRGFRAASADPNITQGNILISWQPLPDQPLPYEKILELKEKGVDIPKLDLTPYSEHQLSYMPF